MFRLWITRDLVTKGKQVVELFNVYKSERELNQANVYSDMYNHGLELIPVIDIESFKKLLNIAKEANTYQKERFHNDVCLQTRGCHCSQTELDKFLAQNANTIKELEDEQD